MTQNQNLDNLSNHRKPGNLAILTGNLRKNVIIQKFLLPKDLQI